MIPLKQFALMGNATFTVRSCKTGTRFTFRVRQPKDDAPHFVSVLNGPDNESNYAFLGTIFNGEKFVHGRKSRITPEAPSAVAFNWVWAHIGNGLEGKVEIFHEGKCCRCGRKLTTPESVEAGIGPECIKHLGGGL